MTVLKFIIRHLQRNFPLCVFVSAVIYFIWLTLLQLRVLKRCFPGDIISLKNVSSVNILNNHIIEAE